ncbi:MAG: hypothetical protein Q9160_002212 [Pyrenula sp. 1 TL-2023]
MNNILHTHLDALDTSLTSLVHAFTSTPTAAAAPESLNALLDADDALTCALRTLHTHQTNYARILALQAEADNLASHIKSTVQRCHDTRNEAVAVIGEDDSESDEEDPPVPASSAKQHQDIDYITLLNFAQRIARYNTAAEREAAELTQRRKAEARAHKPEVQNGAIVNGLQPIPTLTSAEAKAEDQMLTPQIRNWLNSQAEFTKAFQSMPFPSPERLREGILGRLQGIRERDGEEGVWKEVRRLETGGKEAREEAAEERDEIMDTEIRPEERARPSQPQQRREPEKKPAAQLDLDLYVEGDDDDEDD